MKKKITLNEWLDLPVAPDKRAKPEPEERKTVAEWNREPYLVYNHGKKTMRKPRRK